jgi:hypothetical protein
MAGKSNYLENKLIDLIFRGQAFTPPTLYVGLFTASPDDSGGGTEVSTVGTNYARAKACAGASQTLSDWKSTQGDSLSSTGTSGGTSNTIAIVFNTPGATTWGTITSFGIFDSLSGGQLLYWGPLSANKSVNSGDPAPSFPAGTLQITED